MSTKRTVASMLVVFFFCFFVGSNVAKAVDTNLLQEPEETPTPADLAIEEAFHQASQSDQNLMPALMVNTVYIDHIEYAEDGSAALLWLGMRDQATGEVIETEPGLSIAYSASPSAIASPANWSITMPSDEVWLSQLQALPQDLLTEDVQNHVLAAEQHAEALMASGPFRGYKLPWSAGLAKRVTNTIGHVMSVSGGLTSCPATCRYAYDFADGTMFPLLASKGGTVKAFRTTCSNGDEKCTNYLVLEDQSTIPTSYQIYYHMAFNSVPQALRQVGTPVIQGQYIGDTDDTGYSTGHHLHYHVFTSPNSANWSWGPSVDFVYEDVTTNGGYPRTCSEASAFPNYGAQCMSKNLYVSGNTPAHPPAASLSAPVDRQIVTTRTLHFEGTATDDIAIARIQVQANYDGTWKTIADLTPPAGQGGPFAQDINLCTANVPDGPFALAVNIYDREGTKAANIPVMNLFKTASCTTTTAPPKQVSIAAPGVDSKVSVFPFTILANAVDADGGTVKQVDFFWHSGDWSQPQWKKLGSDTNSSDGWSMEVDPSEDLIIDPNVDPLQIAVLNNSAVYAQAIGKAGGVTGAVNWNLVEDVNTPVTRMLQVPATTNSTVIQLKWMANDAQNDIVRYDFQYQTGSGSTWSAWQDWNVIIPGNWRSAWFISAPGKSLRFRMRAVDAAGNIEPYPVQYETGTALAASCTPDTREAQGQTMSTSIAVQEASASPTFNLCKSAQAGAGDVDWVVMDARADEPIRIRVISLGGGAAFSARLFNAAQEMLGSWSSSDYGVEIAANWTPPATGKYFLEIQPLQPGLYGTDAKYQVWYGEGNFLFLPTVFKK